MKRAPALAVAFALVACGDDDDGAADAATTGDAGHDDAGTIGDAGGDGDGGDADPDAGDAATSCAREPGALAEWRAPRAPEHACMADEIREYRDACLDEAAFPIECQQFGAAHAACVACLVSSEDDETWGPLVGHAGWTEVNAGGCIALAGDPNCGERRHAADACIGASCVSCGEDTCPTEARNTVCLEATQAECPDDPAWAACEDGAYEAIATVFCG